MRERDEGDDLLAVGRVGPADDARLRDRRVLEQGLFHVSREDVEAAADDQVLLAVDDVEVAVLVERMALVLQGSVLVRHGDPAVANAFCASRLAGEGGRAYGTLRPSIDFAAIVERHRPRLAT